MIAESTLNGHQPSVQANQLACEPTCRLLLSTSTIVTVN